MLGPTEPSVPFLLWQLLFLVQYIFSYGTAYRLTKKGGDNGLALFGWMLLLSLASYVPGLGIFLWFKFKKKSDDFYTDSQPLTPQYSSFNGGGTNTEPSYDNMNNSYNNSFNNSNDNAYNNSFPTSNDNGYNNSYNNPGENSYNNSYNSPNDNAYNNSYNNSASFTPPGAAYAEQAAPPPYTTPYQSPNMNQFQDNSAMKQCQLCHNQYNAEYLNCPNCGS